MRGEKQLMSVATPTHLLQMMYVWWWCIFFCSSFAVVLLLLCCCVLCCSVFFLHLLLVVEEGGNESFRAWGVVPFVCVLVKRGVAFLFSFFFFCGGDGSDYRFGSFLSYLIFYASCNHSSSDTKLIWSLENCGLGSAVSFLSCASASTSKHPKHARCAFE